MKKDFFFYIAFLVFLFSCSGKNSSSDNKKSIIKDTLQTTYHKPPSSFSDSFIVQPLSAVFYNPDSLQLEKFKKNTSQNVFESTVHDCFFQMRNARMVLKKYWPQIHILETSKARYLVFLMKNNTKAYIDLDFQGDMCGIFLFDGKKQPQLIDMMNVDTALEYYFKNK